MRKRCWFAPARWSVLAALVVSMLLAACSSTGSNTAANGTPHADQLPSHPVQLEIADAGGFVPQFGQAMIDAFANANPNQISKVVYDPRIAAPDLPGKLASEEASGRVTTSLVFTGYDGLASSIQQKLVEQLLPKYADLYQSSVDNYVASAAQYQTFANGYGLVVATTPSGPIFEYDPSKVSNPPTTIQELKQWIIAHPKQFLYAQPPNSGPGRTLLMGLPYLLGDSNPEDPSNGWAKTWQFLKDIKPYILTNPAKTGETMSDLANGTVSMIASTFGWDLNPKILKQVPGTMKTFELQDTKFVPDAAFVEVPKGLDSDTDIVVHNLIRYLLSPAAQPQAYDNGYFYPGPAIQNVPLTDAPQTAQNQINQFLSPDYADWIAKTPVVKPLTPANLVTAFNMWNSNIGGS
jgi:putative spermidine/putrescine transport system substrate-binding protein